MLREDLGPSVEAHSRRWELVVNAYDRLILEERLAEIAEADWKHEAEAARRIARERGIDQATIDQAVNDGRCAAGGRGRASAR
jgi:hypothetical protein